MEYYLLLLKIRCRCNFKTFRHKVKIISNFAVGFGNIDLNAAKKRNIVVTNTPDVLTDATAEIAITCAFGCCQRAKEGMEWAK